jgi:hypothetical protein
LYLSLLGEAEECKLPFSADRLLNKRGQCRNHRKTRRAALKHSVMLFLAAVCHAAALGNMRLSTAGIFTAARQRDGDSR